jgi:putative DNA primase/helicase
VVGGFLARTGTSPGKAKVAVEAIARAAGDEEWRDRRKTAEDAATACHNGGKAYGFPALSEAFGKEVASKVAEWLGYGTEVQATPKQESTAEPPSEDNTVALHSIAASSVEMRAITWLWINRFAIGAFGIIAGLPDEGKGQVVACMTAQVTNGGEWPMKEGRAPQGSVIVFSAEENINDTLVPRLAAAGADLNRVHIIQLAKDKNGERMFNLMTDLPALRQKIIEIGDVKLVTIDPVGAYLGVGKVDSFRGNDVRGVLMPLKTLAEEMKVAIVGVMHFNKKIDVTNALLRISDSLAFGAVARHVYGVIDDAENERRLFVRAKNNAAARSKDKTLAYRFSARMVGTDATTSKEIWAPYVEWEPDYVDVTASEAMTATNENKSPGARNEAKEFLLEYLADGPMSSKAVEDAAEAHGIAKRTLMRARKELGINITKRGFGEQGEWVWQLHPKPDPDTGF